MARRVLGLLVLVASVAGSPPPSLVFLGDFETEARGVGRLGTADLKEALARTKLVTSPVRAGRHALEVNLDRASGKHRTDFYIRDIGGRFKVGREYWYGFSVRFPEDWEPDEQNELFVQWVRTTKNPAGPQLAIYVNRKHYVIRKRWAGNVAELWRGPVRPDRGKWVDWVARVKWSEGKDGETEVWKNGVRIVHDTGPNCYTDGDGKAPYFKFGIYKWPWRKPAAETPSSVTKRRLHFDEIRIGDATASFDSVSPS